MLRNYLKIAFRSFRRQKGIAFINLAGLALGLVAALFILLWVQDELSYDNFHQEKDRIYQVMNNISPSEGKIDTWDGSPEPYGKVLKSEIPEIESVSYHIGWGHVFSFDNRLFQESGYFATADFFDVFTFPFLAGDIETALAEPNSMVISEELAEKYFGSNWHREGRTIGKSIRLDDEMEVQVTGVFATPPTNSSLQFNYIRPMEDLFKQFPNWRDHWGNYMFSLFVKLGKNVEPEAVNDKLVEAIKRNTKGSHPAGMFLHPLTDKYLYSKFENGKVAGGRIEYVRIFFAAALFILLIACINYMNLATARASRRSREVGVRKVVGAARSSLMGQFMTESVVTTLLAAVIALGISQLFLGNFNTLTGKTLLVDFTSGQFWMTSLGIVLLVGVLAGSYPAFMLSSFKIIHTLKGKISGQLGDANLRRGLVVLQFTLSILLIMGAVVVRNQVSFIKNKNLGLDKNNVLTFEIPWDQVEKFEVYKEKLLNQTAVAEISMVSENPLQIGAGTGDPTWEGMQESQRAIFKVITTDDQFLNTMKIPLVKGKGFEKGMSVDTLNFNYIINEEAARLMGFEDPLNKQLQFWGYKGRIIGVVKDFHFATLHSPIRPLIIRYEPEEASGILLRPAPGRTEEALASAEAAFKEFSPNKPFQYEFLDQNYEKMYRGETTTGKLADLFALIAIIISCLGLLGLAAFTAEQRTKEIGIRKVLGASVGHLLLLLNREFGRLILLAFIIAVPTAWYLLNKWLEQFAYHVNIGWSAIALSGGIILLAAILTVSFHSIRTATSNPVDSLRYE